jgi:hypothetical protein
VVAVMSWKAFYAALTAVITAAIACASEFGGLSAWVAVCAQAGAGIVFGGCAAIVVHEAPRLRRGRRARGRSPTPLPAPREVSGPPDAP